MATGICANTECGKEFEKRTHNMRYCSDECCRRATNARLMEQYYDKKARRQGAIRECEREGCNTKLSRYNDGKVCEACEAGDKKSDRARLLDMIGYNGGTSKSYKKAS